MGEKSYFISKDYDSFCNDNKSIDIEKINVFSNQENIYKNEDIISSYNINNNYLEANDNNDLLYTEIYRDYSTLYINYFLLLPLIKFFYLITTNIFVRHNFYNKGATYKNYYLVDLETEQIIFSTENNNLNNGAHLYRNIKLNKARWNE